MEYDPDRSKRIIAFLGVLLIVLLIILLIVVVGGGSDSGDSAEDGSAASSLVVTTQPTPSSTTPAPTAPATLPAPTTTAAATTTTSTSTTTTTTTTVAPFAGDTDDKTCGGDPFPDAQRVFDIRTGKHEGYTRVVFDFDGAVPGCFVRYGDPTTLDVSVFAVDISNPFDPTIFNGGQLAVGLGSVVRVESGGMGGGSGEWGFRIVLTGTQDFVVSTRESHSRLVIDIGD